jgi:hypothetical protein
LKQAPGALYIGSGKEGATKKVLDDAKAALSKLKADYRVVQTKAPGDEPIGWVSRGGPDNCPEASNADQTDTDADGIGDACEAPVVGHSRLHRP